MPTAVPLARTKVLVIDDDVGFRRSTCRLLAAHGFVCVEAAGGRQARELLATESDVAVVLCDITMPGESGIDLLADLTADYPEIAVVMTTGVDDRDVVDTSFHRGAFGYVVKPFASSELLNSLAGALHRRALEKAQREQVGALERTIARTKRLDALLGEIEVDGVDRLRDEEVMDRLSRAVSLRDEETGRHIERMSRYAVVMAKAVDYAGLAFDELRLATALHDVGKIGIADGILLKPGPLTAAERVAMQAHAEIGHRLLADSTSGLLRVAADIALAHHEWWDGGGYPRGLRGEETSEEARMAAVADMFDALTSDRVYRPALSFDEAIRIMSDLRGRQFEPRLLDAFLASMHEVRAIREAFPDREEGPQRIRILVVDDQEIFAHSLVRLLQGSPGFNVVGTAGSVAKAVEYAGAYEPDVVLMDFELPDGDGAKATAMIKARTPAVKVIMLTAGIDDEAFVRAIASGCAGFVKKEEAIDTLLATIDAVSNGETVVPPAELAPLLRQLPPTRRGLGATLTRRELDVLRLAASGLVNKQIAQELGLRLNTVRNHVQNTFYKLNAHSKLEAVATAMREGVLDYPIPAG